MPSTIKLTSILLDSHANGQRQIFKNFARSLSPAIACDYDVILENLNNLKSNDTAAIGGGIMIFHGWLNDWEKPTTSFMRLKHPFEALNTPDHQPIDLVILVLSPTTDGPLHLARLSKITRFIKDSNHAAMLRGANNSDAIEVIFADIENQKRAA